MVRERSCDRQLNAMRQLIQCGPQLLHVVLSPRLEKIPSKSR